MPNKGKLATQRETYEERESDEDKSESEGEVIEVEILITQLAAILRNHRREQCSPKRSQNEWVDEVEPDYESHKPIPPRESLVLSMWIHDMEGYLYQCY